jgi:thiol-disulfide isomerase/thioredoxin
MNRNIILFTVLSLAATSVTAQLKPFVINGTFKGGYNGYVYLQYGKGGRSYQADSVQVKNGKFTFRGELPHPVSASIFTQKFTSFTGNEDMAQVFIEPTTMQLTLEKGHIRDAKLTGSASEKERLELEALNASAREKLKPLRIEYEKANQEYIAAKRAGKDEASLEELKTKANDIKDKMDPFQEETMKNIINWMKAHPASWITAHNMQYYASYMKLDENEAIYAKMPEEIRESSYGKALKKEIDGLRMGSPGSKAHVFAKKDINGQDLSLADFRGKYVLVDFWASWCVPCRKGNPHLLSLYSKYRDKGFEIIGVSDDDNNHEAWKKAVEKDGIGVWKHVLRGLDMKKKMANQENPEDISDYYGIHSLPTKILIDPQGLIIGRYGGGGENDEAMDKKLKEIFGS